MKNILLLLMLFAVGCHAPQKHLQKGNDEKAFASSLRKLKSGKVKSQDVSVFEQSFYLLNQKDIVYLEEMLGEDSLALYPKIYKLTNTIAARQTRVSSVLNRLHRKNIYPKIDWYAIEPVRQEAALKSAEYHYSSAASNFEQARSGNREAARFAWQELEIMKNYQPTFADSEARQLEMEVLGTAHVLVHLAYYFEEDDNLLDDLYGSIFNPDEYPIRRDWKAFYLEKPEDIRIDYIANFKITGVGVTDNIIEEDICKAEKEVEVGKKIVEVWSEQDSAYVKIEEPVFAMVYGEVVNVTQKKNAQFYIQYFIATNHGEPAIIQEDNILTCENWENHFAIKRGDDRAIDASTCTVNAGSERCFPNDFDLLDVAARNGGRRVRSVFRKIRF